MIDEKKLIERLEEYRDSHLIEHDTEECLHCQKNEDDWCSCRNCFICVWEEAKKIVNQLAEEYRQCSKPTCKDCEVYDKEKHYCPKWCELIKRTTEELAEEYNNDVCEWKYHVAPSRNTYFLTDCGHRHNGLLSNNRPYCGFCGKKIKVVE